VPLDKRQQINKEIYFLHESRNQHEYFRHVNPIVDKWSHCGYFEFRDYFITQ
jgi:hypothetical protein